jgi:hypothetical protein
MQRIRWWGDGGRQSHWRTVRVFISSTFNDMHGERDVLTRVVFPQLNNICKSRRVRVVPVDLRWGLTSEDTSEAGLGALEHCLLEIDHSRPFFVFLSGERYGWIPPSYRVSYRPGMTACCELLHSGVLLCVGKCTTSRPLPTPYFTGLSPLSCFLLWLQRL